ncbi:hypothetical protein EV359DRAFT_68306, partial [Lentinula novae-zelandiae]
MNIKQLIERVEKTTKTGKPGWTCIATKCTHQESGNNDSTRIKKHASSCLILAEEYPDKYQWARSGMAKDSIGTKLLQVSEGPTSDTEENEPKRAKQTTLDINVFKEKGRQKDESMRADMQLRVDHLIIRLICAQGLVPEILDSQEWHDLLKTLNPKIKVTASKSFRDDLIPKEAIFVREEQHKILSGTSNLTCSFDGTNVRRKDTFYTVHAITPSRE